MKRLDSKHRAFLLSKSKKEMRRRTRKNKKRLYYDKTYVELDVPFFEGNKRIIKIEAPVIFSMMENLEETVAFFSKVQRHMQYVNVATEIFFDLANVSVITADAVVYLIALMRHNRKKSSLVTCAGSDPVAESAKRVIEEIGFYDYVTRKHFKERANVDDRIQILRSKDVDTDIATKLCIFEMHGSDDSEEGRLRNKRLYSIVIEMMENARQHAYGNGENRLGGNWYVYAERNDGKCRFIFFDTGYGIPSTVKKQFGERLADVLVKRNDARYIASALRGDILRTSTGKDYRGKGLPSFLDAVNAHYLCNLKIFSGRGACAIGKNETIKEIDLKLAFRGTMYVWDMIA